MSRGHLGSRTSGWLVLASVLAVTLTGDGAWAGPVAGAAVSGTKTADSPFPYQVGDTVTYTVTLSNGGPGVQGDNPGNEFTDPLPSTLALVSASSTTGAAVANTGANTVTWNGSLGSGASVIITYNATILPSAAGTSVSNQGNILFDASGGGVNTTAALTDDPTVAGANNPTTITVQASLLEIPTLSGSGLLLMGMILAGLALVLLKRRHGPA